MKAKMIQATLILAVLSVLILVNACSSESSTKSQQTASESIQAKPSFTDKKWIVKQSNSVAAGQSYEFLSDGSLKINAPKQKTAMGTWSYKNKKLIMTEESISYPVDILELKENSFKIKMHNPGEPVDIEFFAE